MLDCRCLPGRWVHWCQVYIYLLIACYRIWPLYSRAVIVSVNVVRANLIVRGSVLSHLKKYCCCILSMSLCARRLKFTVWLWNYCILRNKKNETNSSCLGQMLMFWWMLCKSCKSQNRRKKKSNIEHFVLSMYINASVYQTILSLMSVYGSPFSRTRVHTRAHARSFCPVRLLQQNIKFLVVVSTLLLQRSCLGHRTRLIQRHSVAWFKHTASGNTTRT